MNEIFAGFEYVRTYIDDLLIISYISYDDHLEKLVKVGVLKKINNSKWAARTFIIPKKNGTVIFISGFRE